MPELLPGIVRADPPVPLLQNGRITRDGRIEVRPQFSALSMTAWGLGSDVAAFDLATFEDRLLAFGERSGSTVAYPTQIFSYLGASQGAWKGLFDSAALQYQAFPFVSDFEILWHAPTGNTTVSSDIAYTNGYLCAISTEPNAAISKVWLLKGSTVLATLSLTSCVMVAFSKLPFPGEPMNGADAEGEIAYQARLPEKVTGVSGFGDSYVAFTESGIYEIPGAGPQRNGTGEFFAPRALYSDGGCIDWRSIVDTRIGLFFQMTPD